MFFANDSKGVRTYIKDADFNKKYYCPLCSGELVQRHGLLKAHHFAHKNTLFNGRVSCDDWNNDMSEWHIDWQNAFPKECREIVIEKAGIKHRADVFVNETVIEFQHSVLNAEDFQERNKFYKNEKNRVFWVFDMIKEYSERKMVKSLSDATVFSWNWPSKTFKNFNLEESGIELFFQIADVHNNIHGLKKVVWISPNYKSFKVESAIGFNQEEFVNYVLHYNTVTKKSSKELNNKNTKGHKKQKKKREPLLQTIIGYKIAVIDMAKRSSLVEEKKARMHNLVIDSMDKKVHIPIFVDRRNKRIFVYASDMEKYGTIIRDQINSV